MPMCLFLFYFFIQSMVTNKAFGTRGHSYSSIEHGHHRLSFKPYISKRRILYIVNKCNRKKRRMRVFLAKGLWSWASLGVAANGKSSVC